MKSGRHPKDNKQEKTLVGVFSAIVKSSQTFVITHTEAAHLLAPLVLDVEQRELLYPGGGLLQVEGEGRGRARGGEGLQQPHQLLLVEEEDGCRGEDDGGIVNKLIPYLFYEVKQIRY